jgi:hypothetical protein
VIVYCSNLLAGFITGFKSACCESASHLKKPNLNDRQFTLVCAFSPSNKSFMILRITPYPVNYRTASENFVYSANYSALRAAVRPDAVELPSCVICQESFLNRQ